MYALYLISDLMPRKLDAADRATLKRCFSQYDVNLRSVLMPEQMRKLRCTIRDGLKMNPSSVLGLPEVDVYFPVDNQTVSDNFADLICNDFNITSQKTTDVISAATEQLEILKVYFESAQRAEQFHNASICAMSEMNYTQAGEMYGNEYEKSRAVFHHFYSRVKGILFISFKYVQIKQM